MRPLLWALAVAVPLTSALVTYTFVSSHSNGIQLDATQSAIVCLALIKLVLLGSTGVFPINLDDMFDKTWWPFSRRSRRAVQDNMFQMPAVGKMPCMRRLLCEVETAARTSDQYGVEAAEGVNDREASDEVNPEKVDPLSEVYIEAVRAMYGHNTPDSPDCTEHTDRAFRLMHDINGQHCEQAYRLCPGRYTAPMIFKAVLDEIGLHAEDTSSKLDSDQGCDKRTNYQEL